MKYLNHQEQLRIANDLQCPECWGVCIVPTSANQTYSSFSCNECGCTWTPRKGKEK